MSVDSVIFNEVNLFHNMNNFFNMDIQLCITYVKNESIVLRGVSTATLAYINDQVNLAGGLN